MAPSDIRSTLQTSLFDRPKPISRDAFLAAQPMLFPNEDAFRGFLALEREQDQLRAAKEVIFSLIHSHPVATPTRYLANLLDFEHKSASEDRDPRTDYIPQDHFVHLVNLYLLGIYLYSYHPALHRQCTLALRSLQQSGAVKLQRIRPSAATLVRGYNGYELFGRFWKSFVLLHDACYPLEQLPPAERYEHRDSPPIAPFRDVQAALVKDVGLKALAHLFTLDLLFGGAPGTNLRAQIAGCTAIYHFATQGPVAPPWDSAVEDADRPDGTGSLPDEAVSMVLEYCEGLTHYPRVQGPFALRLLSSVLPDTANAAVLQAGSTGQPLMLLLRAPGPSTYVLNLDTSQAPYGLRRSSAHELADLAFVQARPPRGDLCWEYYTKEGRPRFSDLLATLLPDQEELYGSILQHIRDSLPFHLRVAATEDCAEQIATFTFLELGQLLGYLTDVDGPGDISAAFKIADTSFSRFAKRFHQMVGYSVSEALQDPTTNEHPKPYELLTGKAKDELRPIVEKLVRTAAPTAAQKLVDRIGPELIAEIKTVVALRTCLRVLRERVGTVLPRMNEADFNVLTDDGFFINGELSLGQPQHPEARRLLDAVTLNLQALGLPAFRELLNAYRPPHGSDVDRETEGAGVLDHGLTATCLGLALQTWYAQAVQTLIERPGPDVEPGIAALRLAFVAGTDAEDAALGFETEFMQPRVLASTAIHNIYPAALPEGHRSYRSRLNGCPLTFLALLADGMQLWDRPAFLNPAFSDLPERVAGTDLDLTIEGGGIRLSLGGVLDPVAFSGKYLQNLRDYLAGADRLIEVRARDAHARSHR